MTAKLRLLVNCSFTIITCFVLTQCSKPYVAVRSDEYQEERTARLRYRLNEMLVLYKGTPRQSKRDSIRAALQGAGINLDSLKVRSCNTCNSYVELWSANNIHTVIHGEKVAAGTVSGGS